MTIRQARFIARKIKAFYENNYAWWEIEDLPTVEDLAKEIRKDPAGVSETFRREYNNFNNEWNTRERTQIHTILDAINHPEWIEF